MSIKRPFLKFAINKIESLFEKDKDNPTLMRQIKDELEYRKTKRSKKLKKEVDAIKIASDLNNTDEERASSKVKKTEENYTNNRKNKAEKAVVELVKKKKLETECIATQEKSLADTKTREEDNIHKKALQKVIMIGKGKGYLTYADLNDLLPKDLLTQEQIEPIISILGELDIIVSDITPTQKKPVVDADKNFTEHVKTGLYSDEIISVFDVISDTKILEDLAIELQDLVEYISKNVITQKELKIFKSRRTKTLEIVGKDFGVTRERVRQIELKAFKKTNKFFIESDLKIKVFVDEIANYFFKKNDFINKREVSALFKKIDFNYYLFIIFSNKNVFDFLDKNFTYLVNYGGWTRNHSSTYTPKKSLDSSFIKKEFYKSQWPVTLTQLIQNSGLSRELLIKEILNDGRFFVKKVGSVEILTTIKKISQPNIIRFCIRTNGVSGLLDIIKFSKEEFDKESTRARISSAISTMKDVINVGRGKYDFISNIGVSDSDIDRIKKCAEQLIMDQQKFISIKIILPKIKACLDIGSLQNINEYVLNELLKKDKTFDCNRGFMVGLKSDKFSGKYLEQVDEIVLLMKEKGIPLTVGYIFNQLTITRVLLRHNVENLLNDNKTFFSEDGELFYLSELKDESNSDYIEKKLKANLAKARKKKRLLKMSSMLNNGTKE